MRTISNKFPLSSAKSDWASFSDLLLFNPSVMFHSLQPHGLQHPRLPCPSLSPRAYSNSGPLSWCCNPTISSSVIPNWHRPQKWTWPRAVAEVKVRENISNQHDSWSPPWLLLYSHQGHLPTKFASKRKMQNFEDWLLHAYISKAI